MKPKMMKVYFAFAWLLGLAFGLTACGPTVQDIPDCVSEDIFCVGLVTDLGGLNDQAINQAAWEAVQQAVEKFGLTGHFIETVDSRDYAKNIAYFGEAGYDLIVTVGNEMTTATTEAAEIYTDTRFIGVDLAQASVIPANMTILSFSEDQAGFLAGALAGQVTRSGMVGAVCSTDLSPVIWRYCEGYRVGVIYTNPNAQITVTYHSNEVGIDETFSDPEWGLATANAMIEQGVDVILGAGGTTGEAALIAASDAQIFAIGIESDQYLRLREARPGLLSSAVKQVTAGTFKLIRQARNADFPGGEVIYGEVGTAPFHEQASQVPDQIRDTLKEIARGLNDGEILTNVEPVKP